MEKVETPAFMRKKLLRYGSKQQKEFITQKSLSYCGSRFLIQTAHIESFGRKGVGVKINVPIEIDSEKLEKIVAKAKEIASEVVVTDFENKVA